MDNSEWVSMSNDGLTCEYLQIAGPAMHPMFLLAHVRRVNGAEQRVRIRKKYCAMNIFDFLFSVLWVCSFVVFVESELVFLESEKNVNKLAYTFLLHIWMSDKRTEMRRLRYLNNNKKN